MSGQENDRQDDKALAAALRQHAEQVPPEVADRLRAMRRAAVAELDVRSTRAGSGWLLPAGVAAAGLALTLALLTGDPESPAPGAVLLADTDELAAVAELEVLEELEFLAWLEEETPVDGEG